jgi:pimeloyl-ACP methyl ester carboxylesterase
MIHSTHQGSGSPPFVFIHAFGCARSDWDKQLQFFSNRHELVAVDLGGHGTTPARVEHCQVETHGADVAALITALNLAPAVIIGNSLGCRVALEVAARVPAHTKALILVDGSRLGQVGDGPTTGHAILGNGVDANDYAEFVVGMFAKMFSPGCDPRTVVAMTERAQRIPAQLAAALLADVGRHDAEKMDELLASLTVPVHLIQSTMITADGARVSLARGQTSPYLEMMKSKVAAVSIDIVEDSGHYPPIERAENTNAAINQFVQRLSAI